MLYPILVIEDDAKIAQIVKVYLEGAGFRVTHAQNGKEALDQIAKEPPLLVILDLMLPDTTGEELCLRIADLSKAPETVAEKRRGTAHGPQLQ
jgi:two-component system OmpR family response regulator